MENTRDHGITVHVADRLEVLADALGALLERPRADPFEMDMVCVPTPGVQRWVAQRLSQRLGAVTGDGVCAGVDFASLTAVCDRVLAAKADGSADELPWGRERLVWAVLRAFDTSAGEDWFAPVRDHLAGGDEARPGRRYATARRLAALYVRWLTWRPSDLEAWLHDGTDHWQARLWRVIAAEIGDRNPFEAMRAAVARIAADPTGIPVPSTLHVLAPNRVPPLVMDVVTALAQHRTVHVWLPAASAGPLASLAAVRRRQLADWTARAAEVATLDRAVMPMTLLESLQSSAAMPAESSAEPPAGDGTVEIHVSHGPERQVEILRDILVDALARDTALEPRDIVVLTPDLETYGPLVRARCTLGALAPADLLHPVHGIRVGVADRSQREVNPVLDVLMRVLRLATSRASVSELQDLIATGPVGRRFGLTGSDTVERIGRMLSESGVRWGMDQGTRRRFGVTVVQNTWQAGLNRLLVGLTMSERDLVALGNAFPYDVLDSQDVSLVGSLAELMGRLRAAADEFATPATPPEWVERFRRVLFGAPDTDGVMVGGLVSVAAADGWQTSHAQAQLSQIAFDAGPDAPELAIGDITALVADRLQGLLPRSALFTGQLTVTSLDALPTVPHDVVVVVGLDDQSFPRPVVSDGDDVLGVSPAESNPALDDRQAFLDALTSARKRFVVVYRGRDTRTNEPVPPPVPVQDLRQACRGRHVELDHSLQPFDVGSFVPGAPVSYDRSAARAAIALVRGRSREAAPARNRLDLDGILPSAPDADVDLDELVDCLSNPWGYFQKRRLNVSTWTEERRTDEIPIDTSGLDLWRLKNTMLEQRLAGHSRDQVELAERLRGGVPPANLGSVAVREASLGVDQTLAAVERYQSGAERIIDVEIAAADTVVVGRVRVHGSTIVTPITGFMKGRHFLRPWVHLVALAATDPSDTWRAVVMNDRKTVVITPPPDPVTVLSLLVRLQREALQSLVPLPADVGHAWVAGELRSPEAAESQARKEFGYDKTYRSTVFDTFDELASAPGPGGPGAFARLATAVYGPMVTAGAR